MVTPLHILPRKVARKKLPQRWHDQGWETYKEAYDFFRKIVRDSYILGFRPGDMLQEHHARKLTWLLSACPTFNERFPSGVRYFTLWDNGREQKDVFARYSFAAVDLRGIPHGFNLALALRAKHDPFYCTIPPA